MVRCCVSAVGVVICVWSNVFVVFVRFIFLSLSAQLGIVVLREY